MQASTNATFLEIARFCSMHTLELYGDILQPGGQLETPGLVFVYVHKVLTLNWNKSRLILLVLLIDLINTCSSNILEDFQLILIKMGPFGFTSQID